MQKELIHAVKKMFEIVFKGGKSYIFNREIGLYITAFLVIWLVISVCLPMFIGNYRSIQIESSFFAFYGITLGFLIVAYTSALSLLYFRMEKAPDSKDRIEIIKRYENYYYYLFFTILVNIVVLFMIVY